MVTAERQTMQIGDNYLNDGHLPPEITRTESRNRELPCRPPHTNNRSFNPVSHPLCLTPDRRGVLWSSRWRQPDDHLHCRPPSPTATAVGCGWSSAAAGVDLTLMWLHAILLQNWYWRFADANSPICRHALKLPIFDAWCVHQLNN